MAWIYNNRTGKFYHREISIYLITKGYSGKGIGLNNPQKEKISDVGPIPAGEYSIGKPFFHLDIKCKHTLRLIPINHNAHKRKGFLIHGDNKKLDFSASKGCIILPMKIRRMISESGDNILIVKGKKWLNI